MTTEAFIYDYVRTPRGKGKAGGGLNTVKPVTLLAGLMTAIQQRNQLDTSLVDDIVIGCVSPIDDQGSCLPRVASIYAGWDEDTPGIQIDRFCASGFETVNMAAMKIRSGWEDLVVAGGVESMSRVPMMSPGGAWANDPETAMKVQYVPQGIGADVIATQEGFSREDVDRFALTSHQRAAAAITAGHFKNTIVPVVDQNGFLICDTDELVRADSTMESLGKLKASFQATGDLGFDAIVQAKYNLSSINHVHTPGNSSGIVDGAALLLLGSEAMGKKLGLKAKGRVVASAVVGSDPCIMLTGPMPAARKALKKAGMTIDQIDLFEVNEAFASVTMKFAKEMGVSMDKINVNGGSIAMGHPLGATGAMLIGAVLDELERRGLRYGLCTACVGAGMGIATIVERL
jgi:acetyl-CoA C-acetyltransferase